MTARVVLLLNNPFTADSRSWKLAGSLAAAGLEVTVVARARDGLAAREEGDGYTVLRIDQPRPLAWLPAPGLPPGHGRPPATLPSRVRDAAGRAAQAARYLLLARQWADRIAAAVPSADVWQAEGLITLPVALRLRGRQGGRVVYDSRDLHVESARFARLPGPWRRLLGRAERRWARSADGVVTVSSAYAAVLERTLAVRPTIVWNGPVRWDRPEPPERLLHRRLGLPERTRIVLQLGALQPHRGIEELIDAVAMLDDVALVVVGDGPQREALVRRAASQPRPGAIHFLPAAAPDEILPLTASADVAAMPIHGSTLNHRLTTPTRLFDAMGAGTPVVASDLPGMAPIVRETGCGVLCDPTLPADIARAIREVLDAPPQRRAAFRAAGLQAARTTYAWDRQVDALLALYGRLG